MATVLIGRLRAHEIVNDGSELIQDSSRGTTSEATDSLHKGISATPSVKVSAIVTCA